MIRSHGPPVASAVAAGSNCGRRSTALKKSPTADLGLSKSFCRPRMLADINTGVRAGHKDKSKRLNHNFFRPGASFGGNIFRSAGLD